MHKTFKKKAEELAGDHAPDCPRSTARSMSHSGIKLNFGQRGTVLVADCTCGRALRAQKIFEALIEAREGCQI